MKKAEKILKIVGEDRMLEAFDWIDFDGANNEKHPMIELIEYPTLWNNEFNEVFKKFLFKTWNVKNEFTVIEQSLQHKDNMNDYVLYPVVKFIRNQNNTTDQLIKKISDNDAEDEIIQELYWEVMGLEQLIEFWTKYTDNQFVSIELKF
jgi:hypothetical protein